MGGGHAQWWLVLQAVHSILTVYRLLGDRMFQVHLAVQMQECKTRSFCHGCPSDIQDMNGVYKITYGGNIYLLL